MSRTTAFLFTFQYLKPIGGLKTRWPRKQPTKIEGKRLCTPLLPIITPRIFSTSCNSMQYLDFFCTAPTDVAKAIREYHGNPCQASLVCKTCRMIFRLPKIQVLKRKLGKLMKSCRREIDYVPFHHWMREGRRWYLEHLSQQIQDLTAVINALKAWAP